MLRGLILALFLTGCTPTMVDDLNVEEISKPIKTKYKVGECTYLVEPSTGKGSKKNAMRVEEVTSTSYVYRWWVPKLNSNPPEDEWAIGTNIGTHDYFERITKRLDKCPG